MPLSDLEEWNRRWHLHAEKVSCRSCQVEQEALCRDQPFEHLPYCPYGTFKRTPWAELDAALKAAGPAWH